MVRGHHVQHKPLGVPTQGVGRDPSVVEDDEAGAVRIAEEDFVAVTGWHKTRVGLSEDLGRVMGGETFNLNST